MPIYEYRRPDGTTFEIQQSFSDAALIKDPDTGVPVERVLHAPAVHFKGKGFYNTDYGTRNRQREEAAKSSDKSDSSSGGDSSSKSDSSKSESNSSSASDSSSGSSPSESSEKKSDATKKAEPAAKK